MEAKEDIKQKILEAAKDGRAACKVLLGLAAETSTPPREIGHLCNEMDIRIAACQLGCFGRDRAR